MLWRVKDNRYMFISLIRIVRFHCGILPSGMSDRQASCRTYGQTWVLYWPPTGQLLPFFILFLNPSLTVWERLDIHLAVLSLLYIFTITSQLKTHVHFPFFFFWTEEVFQRIATSPFCLCLSRTFDALRSSISIYNNNITTTTTTTTLRHYISLDCAITV